ncbi:unnamed protein product, partial [Polarella glacialis]
MSVQNPRAVNQHSDFTSLSHLRPVIPVGPSKAAPWECEWESGQSALSYSERSYSWFAPDSVSSAMVKRLCLGLSNSLPQTLVGPRLSAPDSSLSQTLACPTLCAGLSAQLVVAVVVAAVVIVVAVVVVVVVVVPQGKAFPVGSLVVA